MLPVCPPLGSKCDRNSSNYSHTTSSSDDQQNDQLRAYVYNYASSEDTNTDSEDGVGGPPSLKP